MKLKRTAAIVLVFCLIFSLAACANDRNRVRKRTETTAPGREEKEQGTTDPEKSNTPLLYKVSDADGDVIWLFGSIHVGEESFYPLPEYVTDAYESAERLAVECDVIAASKDFSAQTAAMAQLVYTDGTTISDHIPEELYTQAVEILDEGGLYLPVYDRYCPALWSTMIDNILMTKADVDSSLGVDMHLLQKAYDDGKQIVEIESIQFQYAMLAGFSNELQVMLLESSVASYDSTFLYKAQLRAMMNAWAEGDEAAFAKLLNQEYNENLITNRNISMADFAEDALESGDETFICVGAAHVVGEDAMADLLAERGYTVEIIKE